MQKKKFHLKSGMTPKGDQPEAIKALVAGIKGGKHSQVLLGATGTGKSLTGDEIVHLYRQRGGKFEPMQMTIGQVVDHMIQEGAFVMHSEDGTEIVDANLCPESLYVPSVNPQTGAAEMKKITYFQRHASPKTLFAVQTKCGRKVKVTGDHNFFILRNGRLMLVRTDEILATDNIPLPAFLESVCSVGELESINLLRYLDREDMHIDVAEYFEEFIAEVGQKMAVAQMQKCAESQSSSKLWRVRNYGERVPADAVVRMFGHGFSRGTIGSRLSGHNVPINYPVTDSFLSLLGLYIAEGCVTKNYFCLSVREKELEKKTEAILKDLNLSFGRRADGDFQVNDKAFAALLRELCGKGAFNKKLPDFWPRLSLNQLGKLLAMYFAGDGWVDKNAVMCTTGSEQLASELLYALSRFGVWGRMKKRFQKATNGGEGNWFYQITISWQRDLRRFYEKIGFSLRRKQDVLFAKLHSRENTNVDLAPGAGRFLKGIREKFGFLQKDLAKMAGLSRSAISLIEIGDREISRKALKKFLQTWSKSKFAKLECEEISALQLLANSKWAQVAEVKEFKSEEEYVYDFSVEGNETFLAGFGGMFVHNTFTIANVIQEVQRPTLIVAHNKTLAAQLCSELKEMFPDAAVQYFVSYYDYYQPEAYIAHSDTYIEKDAQINDEINKYRHSATASLLTRTDVIIVASVSCIYGLGSPQEYLDMRIEMKVDERIARDMLLRKLTDIQYERSRADFKQGMFHVLGDTVEIFPPGGDSAVRLEFWDDEIEKITEVDPFTGEVLGEMDEVTVFPAKHSVTTEAKIEAAVDGIRNELEIRVDQLKKMGKNLEAERIKTRTEYDLEILQETGYVTGIENYVRYLNDLPEGGKTPTLMDYFPDDFLLVIDESHMTVPQIGAMHNGNLSRKQSLVEHGFRLPSAYDNRPLKFEEFEEYMHDTIYVSATPGKYEMAKRDGLVEQIIRPTGLLDPSVEVRPKEGQIADIMKEIKRTIDGGERVLLTTLTKRSAEDLTEYLTDADVRVRYLHSDVDTLERIEIIRDLRLGKFDVLVGINLLREGLDMPEVSFIGILDADKQGFLRSTPALIQTIGRAARNVNGHVVMYADVITPAMEEAIDETNRRRATQEAFNKKHGITPQTIKKAVKDIEMSRKEAEKKQVRRYDASKVPKEEVFRLIEHLEVEMDMAAQNMEFEKAAELRDEIEELREKA